MIPIKTETYTWKRSSFCGNSSCVEIVDTGSYVHIKDKENYTVSFTREEWDAFIKGVKAGEFD